MSRIPYKISKFLFYTILVLFISWILLSFYSDLYAVDLTENEIIINKANTYQINLIPKNPKRFKYDNYIFESEDPQIAQVDKSGIVTAIKNGETNIIIRYKYGIKKVNLAISVSDVKISQIDTVSDIDLNVNETRKIDVKLNGKDNIITHLNYKSEDEDIAYVDSFGNVTGISEGYTYLIVSASGETQNKIRVNVRYVNEEIQEIGLEEKELTLRVGKEYKLNLLTIPRSANTSKVTWKSNNTNVVSVDGKGNVKAKKAGSATISVKINNLETACVINVVEDKVLVLNAYNEELEVGSEMVLSSNIESSFKSSDSDIASIDSNGNIKAKKTGTVTINVTSKTGLTNKCIIKVIPKKVEVSNIRIDKQIVNMNTGDTITLKPIIEPSNATNKNITYTSSNTSVISVDSDGRVVAKNAGKSIVTLRTNNGKVVSVTINVSVKNILPESIMFSKSKMDMYVGDYTYLQAITKPIDITNKVFEWSSSNSSIVTVNNFGMITAKKTGTSTISAKTENGLVAKIVINVIEKGKDNISIKLNEKELTLTVGKTKKLSYSVSGNIPKNETITWSSSDSNIVSVDKNGNIKALRSGYALIKVSVMDKYDSCLVEVKEEKVKTVKIEPSKAELKLGSSLKLNAIIEPSSATNKEVIWLSGDKNIATVDSTGRVTPKKAGTVTISAMSNNGIVASSTIKVVDITPTKITINQGDLELVEGDSTQLTVSYTPSNSTNKEIVFESATPNIAKVDSNGKLTAVSKGTTKISVYLSSNKSIKSEILVTVSSKNVNVESIVIDKVKANVYEGSVISLSAIIVPSNATDKTVTWKSSNSSIASVDSNGNVTGHKKGVVIITATTKNGKTSTSQITVISSKVEVESIRITSNVQSLYVGDTINMSYEVSPNNATDKSVIWSTSDETKASIDEMGRVTGLRDGVVYITVRSRSNTKLSFTKNIYIWNKVIPMNSITLNKSSIYLLANNSTQLLTTITPANATNKTIIWSSSNPRVASVDSNGVVTGLKSGTTTITASSIDETLKATCEVTVEEIIDVEKITLNKSSVTLNAGQEYQLIATVTPTNATNRTLTYSSNNASVASIDRNGKITALKEGNATITVSSADKKASTTCEIIVKKEEIKVNSISIKENISTMNVGEQKQLTVLFDPVNTTDKTLAWSSSDNSILTVSQSGLLNAKSEGTAKIWVCVKGSCDKTMLEKEITVKVGIKSIKINENISTMNVGEKKQLTITYDPTNATDKTLAWSSSDNSVLTVSQSGLLTAKGEGTAKIWVCVKGSCSKTMLEKEITVKIGVKSISITDDLSNINAGTSKKLNVVFTPSNATNKTLAWSSENTSVARISQDGVLTAVGEGTTKIWVFARDNYNGTIQSIDVSVKVGVKSISITDDLSNLKVGVTKKLNVTFTPSNATNKTLAWSSENTSVAKITQDGVLTAVGEGTTKIWVFAKGNYNGTIQ